MSAAPGRPLPLITEENEFFWTSGADGILRLQECRSCESLIPPPAPVCRYCRSLDVGVRAVSGKASLAGFILAHERLRPPQLFSDLGLGHTGLLARRHEQFAQFLVLRRVDRRAHVGRWRDDEHEKLILFPDYPK